MIWVFLAGGLALAGFIALALYAAVPLRQKIDAVRDQVGVLDGRLAELRALIGQLETGRLRRH